MPDAPGQRTALHHARSPPNARRRRLDIHPRLGPRRACADRRRADRGPCASRRGRSARHAFDPRAADRPCARRSGAPARHVMVHHRLECGERAGTDARRRAYRGLRMARLHVGQRAGGADPGSRRSAACRGTGPPLLFVTLNTRILSSAAPEDTGAASALLQSMQQLGGALGVAVLTTLYAARPAAPGSYCEIPITFLLWPKRSTKKRLWRGPSGRC
jgi:hypothetical protein